MKLKLETSLSTKELLIAIPLLLYFPGYLFLKVMPVADPLTYWASFFLLWFLPAFFGVLWAGDDDGRQGLVAIILGLMILCTLLLAQHSSFMFTMFETFGGLFAGMAGAAAFYIIKRTVDRMRGLPAQPVQPMSGLDKDIFKFAIVSYGVGTYLLIDYQLSGGWRPESIWYWIGALLIVLWAIVTFRFIYKYHH